MGRPYGTNSFEASLAPRRITEREAFDYLYRTSPPESEAAAFQRALQIVEENERKRRAQGATEGGSS